MIERTAQEKTLISLRMAKALALEMATLYKDGNKKSSLAIVDYLTHAENDSLIRLHDILTGIDK